MSNSVFTRFKRTCVALFGLFVLSACEPIEEYTSSSAGQEFVDFRPPVQAPQPAPVVTPATNTSSGTSASTDSSTDSSTGTSINAPSLSRTGIVWKPVSEGDGKLVILTPTSYGDPTVTILNAAGKTIERGRSVGRTNGNRATYRFSRPGRGYSAPALLRVGSKTYLVSSPANRYN